MSSRASGGALAASLIMAAIVGFAGGAYFGTQAEGSSGGPNQNSTDSATTPGGDTTDAGNENGDEQEEEPAGNGLSLTAEQSAVAPDEQIDLAGALEPPEAGVVVRVQRSIDDGEWEDFPVEWTTRDDGTFSGWIQSSREGVNSLRVVRTDDDAVVSAPVDVTIEG